MQPPSSPLLHGPLPEPETAEDALMSLLMALGRRMRQRQPGDVVDYSAFPILKLLSHQGPMRLSGVAQVLGLDASTVSRHVKQLEDRGLLARTCDPDDGRASRVAVSDMGTSTMAAGLEARHHVVAAALDGWTDDERETLRQLLGRLVSTLMTQHDQHAEDSAAQTSKAER